MPVIVNWTYIVKLDFLFFRLDRFPVICVDIVDATLPLLKIRVRQAGRGLCERLGGHI